MNIAIHGDPGAHAIPGGVGVYVRRLVEQLVDSHDGNTYRVLVSRWPVAPLYAAWNYLGHPRVSGAVDIVHATALVIPPARRAKLVATVHDLALVERPEVVPQFWRRVYRRGLERAVAEAEVLCAVSVATRDALIGRYGVETGRVIVTPEAPNVTPASERDDNVFPRLDLHEPYILNVGTVEPRKNQIGLVRAFAAADDRLAGHTLVIAGMPGWGHADLIQAIDALPTQRRIVVAGGVSDGELAALYARARVFALPSLDEGFGLPLAEALSFGVPSVVSRAPALVEVAGDAAMLIDATDTDALADTLGALATDDHVRARLSTLAHGRATQFTWEATADLTRRAYAQAAAR